MNDAPQISIIGITGLPEIKEGDDLGSMIVRFAQGQDTPLASGDILVVTQKIVSKAEGRLVDLRTIEPSAFAVEFASHSGRDARRVELVLRESRSVVRMDAERGIMITETKHGFVCANSGIDSSNVFGEDYVCLLPEDPDASAEGIRIRIRELIDSPDVPVIISDTFGRAWREGHGNFAIGVSGMDPLRDYRGEIDASGKLLRVTNIAVADELAGAAELVMAKVINVPVAIVRGYAYSAVDNASIAPMLRERSRDLFR